LRQIAQHDRIGNAPYFPISNRGFYHGAKVQKTNELLGCRTV
jgi:hypothetical protein